MTLRYIRRMRLVLDTNVVVSALRSQTGGSNALLIAAFEKRFTWMCSVPLFWEYEDVLSRGDLLLDTGFTRAEMAGFLTDIAGLVKAVDLHFMWRPQLSDPNDEMVLEAAVNGRADALVTHNGRDFTPAIEKFRVGLWTPADALQRIEK